MMPARPHLHDFGLDRAARRVNNRAWPEPGPFFSFGPLFFLTKIESFNGRLRQECLNAHWFLSLDDARRKIEAWRAFYNEMRPHTALHWLTPAEFARKATEREPKEAGNFQV